MRIRWTPEASENLDHLCSRIAQNNPAAALRAARAIFDGVVLLVDFPQRGRVGTEGGTRELVFTPLPYVVVYRLAEQVIEILHIWHGAQDR